MKTIESLKKRLSSYDTLITQTEEGFVDEVSFQWNQPISNCELEKIINSNDLSLPESYIEFLKISNGAVLFQDIKYGQWGCKILGLQDMMNITEERKKQNNEINSSQFIFSTWIGDGDFLMFDTEKLNTKKYIIDCWACDPISQGTILKWEFDSWLDRLIVAQGAKFWRW